MFKGDVSKSCNLEELRGEDKVCLDPGTYTLQILIDEEEGYDVAIGTIASLNLHFRAFSQQYPTIYFDHQNPENMGKIGFNRDSVPLPGISLLSSKDYYESEDTFIKIGNSVLSGHFIYREFYLCNPNKLQIIENGTYISYLFKGRVKSGNGQLVKGAYGGGNPFSVRFRYPKSFESSCKKLPAGWYSLVSVHEEDCQKETITLFSELSISVIDSSAISTLNYPYRAHEVENLEPISWEDDNGNPGKRVLEKTYQFPYSSSSCEPDKPVYLPKYCLSEGNHNVAYYVFRLEKPSFVYTSIGQLFPFNVKKDSLKFLDSSSAIAPCSGYSQLSYYCNLQPGVYTLVVLKDGKSGVQPEVRISPAPKTVHDFANNAFDIGEITSGISKTPGEQVTCHAGINGTDYPKLWRANLKNNKSMTNQGGKNVSLDYYYRGNVWYTFTAKDAGEITLSIIDVTRSYPKDHFDIILYEAPKGKEIPFSDLQSGGLVDSTVEGGLSHIYTYNSGGEFTVKKSSCGKKRYYVLVSFFAYNMAGYQNAVIPNFHLSLNLDFTPSLSASSIGDYCANAVPVSISNNKQKSAEMDISCHTIGESYGEDGSNLGCLGDRNDIKTSWFKVSYSGTKKNDLSFSLEENSSANITNIKYRVLYGSCKSMTPGPCVDNSTGSFKLDCMDKGDYYIQVSSPKSTYGKVKLTATSTTTQYQQCKPFDLHEVKAVFSVEGGCNNQDTLHFYNKSTQGEDIRYLWDFGDGHTSTDLSPRHLYNSTSALTDTFIVKLKVENIRTGRKSQIVHPVYFFNNIWLTLPEDTTNFCSNEMVFDPKLNFTPTEVLWSPDRTLNNSRILNPTASISYAAPTDYIIMARYFNCKLIDTMTLYYINSKPEYFQGKICSGDSILIGTRKDTLPIFEWSTGETSEEICINHADTFVLKSGFSEDCLIIDSFLFDSATSPRVRQTSTPKCIGDLLEIEALNPGKHWFLWENNIFHSGPSIIAIDTGWYKVSTQLGTCSRTDSFYVSPDDFMYPTLSDTALCSKDVRLKVAINGANYLWNTGDTSQAIKVKEDGTYTVEVSKGKCAMVDKAKITFKTLAGFEIDDVIICDSSEKTIYLDTSFNYRWYDNSTQAFRVFKELGKYWVDVTDDECSTRVNVQVRETHDLKNMLGRDTALCYPPRFLLNFTENVDSFWWSTGEVNEKYIQARDTGMYWLRVKYDGCYGMDSIHIDSLDCYAALYIPNAFTPLNKNPFFLCKGVKIDSFQMRIYNRWGEYIFTSDELSEGWDGTLKGADCPEDVYLYVIHYKKRFGKPTTTSGGFLLIR